MVVNHHQICARNKAGKKINQPLTTDQRDEIHQHQLAQGQSRGGTRQILFKGNLKATSPGHFLKAAAQGKGM